MSFILDALKKSEAERQRQAGPALLEMRVMRPQRRFPSWLLVVGGILILVNLLAVLWLFLRPASPSDSQSNAEVSNQGTASSGAVADTAAAKAPATAVPALAPLAGVAEGPQVIGGASSAPDQVANPADLEPATSGNSAGGTRSGVRSYADVSDELPALRLDLHVYTARPADRYAFINMHKVKEGDTTGEGMRVMQITPDGVVLEYRNTEFLLGRE